MMLIRLVAVALIFAGATSIGCRSRSAESAPAAVDQTPVIVEINGSPEHLASFERFVRSRLSDFYPQLVQKQVDHDELRSRLFDEFVRRQLIVHEARKRGLHATDEEVGRVVEEQHQQTSADPAGQNQTALGSGERRAEIATDLLTMKYYQLEVLKDVRVTPEEIENYYREHPSRYQQNDGFYVREIRVAEASEADRLYRQALEKPDDFATLAREHSNAPNAVNGGLIYYENRQLPPVLEQAITPLKVGAVSQVVHSNYGYHLFKLEARAEPLPLEKVRPQIEEELLRSRNQGLIDAYNERAVAGAQIRIYHDRLGFNYQGKLRTEPPAE
jgi:peptidyl-prolyl cis-trans isomerase C/foldase protein PrsA